MQIVIDIPEEDYNKGTLVNYFGCMSKELDEVIQNGTLLEDYCDSCVYKPTESEESE